MDRLIAADTMVEYLKTPVARAALAALAELGFTFTPPNPEVLKNFVPELVKLGPTTYADLDAALEKSMPFAAAIAVDVARDNQHYSERDTPLDEYIALFQFAIAARWRLGTEAGWKEPT